MLKATDGVNTHKGAIFCMGLLCAATGRLSPDTWQADRILTEAGAMAAEVLQTDLSGITPETAVTTGQQLYAAYGITGIRGQAAAGFPAIREVGLPALQRGLKQGLSLNDAGAATLLHLLTVTEDTNIIHRSDLQTLHALQAQLTAQLSETPYPTPEEIKKLDSAFIERNLSPGGTADLLAATYFLFFLGAG